jgi:hypothetical protein
MSTSRARVSQTRTPQSEAEEGALERLWGVAVCLGCGTPIVLGESVAGSRGAGFAGLCSSCRAMPAVAPPSAPASIRTAGTDVREVATTLSEKSARMREAA